MYSNNTIDFVALLKIINMIVRHLGKNSIWINKHENVIEQLCTEFNLDEDGDNDINAVQPNFKQNNTITNNKTNNNNLNAEFEPEKLSVDLLEEEMINEINNSRDNEGVTNTNTNNDK